MEPLELAVRKRNRSPPRSRRSLVIGATSAGLERAGLRGGPTRPTAWSTACPSSTHPPPGPCAAARALPC